MTARPFVYVAGPITKPEPMENAHNAIIVATELLDSGKVVPFVPHLTCFWHLITPRSYQTWLDYDFDVLARCDALLRLPGESPGADRELLVALSLHLPVFHGTDDLLAWAQAWIDAGGYLAGAHHGPVGERPWASR